jgi:hypothetical protein
MPKLRTHLNRQKQNKRNETPTPRQQAAIARGDYAFKTAKVLVDGVEMDVNVRNNVPHRPSAVTRHQVSVMAAIGLQQLAIAKILGVTTDVLTKYYRDELDVGQDRATKIVAAKLFKTAAFGKGKDALAAQMFWLRTRGKGKFNETQRLEHTGADGAPIETVGLTLTDEERAIRIAQLLNAAAEEGAGRPAPERNGGLGSLAGPTD